MTFVRVYGPHITGPSPFGQTKFASYRIKDGESVYERPDGRLVIEVPEFETPGYPKIGRPPTRHPAKTVRFAAGAWTHYEVQG